MKSICFGGENRGSAQRYFRADLPAQVLQRKGWNSYSADLVACPEAPEELIHDARLRGAMRKLDAEGNVVDILVTEPPPDIITLRLMDDFDVLDPERPPNVEKMAESILAARKAGQIVVYDLDDDVWNIPEWSPAFTARNQTNAKFRAVQLDVLNANLAACDGAICTTDRISEVARKEVPGLRTWVLRNGIDPGLWEWPRKVEDHEPLRVGWMGSISHHTPHLRTMDAALSVLNDYGAEFVFCGWTPGTDKEVQRVLASLPCPARAIPWVDFREMPKVLAELDVGIIPRTADEFCHGQSHSSGLEYACAGVPFIATATHEYERLAKLGAGLVARDVADWRMHLHALLQSAELRRTYRETFRSTVLRLHGPAMLAEQYHQLFSQLVEARAA